MDKLKKAIIFLLLFLSFILTSCSQQAYKHMPPKESEQIQEPEIKQDSSKDIQKGPQELESEKNAEEVKESIPVKEVLSPPKSFLKEADYELPEDKVYYEGKAVVLTYHHISTDPPTGITITPERFEEDLKMLRDNNFNVISMRDMLNGIDGKGKLPPNAVVITFDDGYASFHKYAFPLLKKYNMPSTVFIITLWAETFTPSGKEFDLLTPEQIREVYKSGLVDIQSHSYDGHKYVVRNEKGQVGGALAFQVYDKNTGTYEAVEVFRKRVVEDLQKSIAVIEKYTDNKSDILCFPFGHYNSRLIELSEQAGFKYFVTTVQGNNKENSENHIIYRIRSGDLKLSSNELKNSIINSGGGRAHSKPAPKPTTP